MNNKTIKGSKGGCFAKETLISTPNGNVPIRKLTIGEEIFGFDGDNKELVVVKITETHKHKTTDLRGDRLLLVRHPESEIILTENHWMYVGNNEFVEMQEIEIGDYLIWKDGSRKVVYDKLILPDQEYVYNLTTTNGTFIADGLRVHNKGGGKSSSQPYVPIEDANSLQSNAVARMVDLIGEGEIEGLVDGDKSIFLNETQLQNDDSSYNFAGVTTYCKEGTSTQTYIPGITNAAASATSVNLEVVHATPIVKSITDTDVDDIRVVVSVPSLYKAEDNGDIKKTSVTMKIEVQPNGGAYQDAKASIVISGKCTSAYQRAIRIKDLSDYGTGPWNVRVSRTTADSTTAKLVNKTYWTAYSEIKERKIQYRDSVIVGMEVDAKQFGSSIPNRAYDVKGLKILTPNNRTWNEGTDIVEYSGTWDGNFGTAEYCDNPAWVLYDILTTDRYGLGLASSYVDKWGLYNLGVYCDTQVDDGIGGTERRFTFNYVIQNKADAFHVIAMIASNMRAVPYWTAGLASFTQDSPKDSTRLVSAANVEGGMFNYAGNSLKERYTVAYVTWNDPNAFYKQTVEVVENTTGISNYGYKPIDVVAYGCSSRGQAHRYGKWILESQLIETERIEYTAGYDHIDVVPGEIIDVADPHKSATNRFGGRIVSSTSTSLTIDNAVDLAAGETYSVEMITSGGVVEKDLTNSVPSSDVTVLTWTGALSTQPADNAMWLLVGTELEPTSYRVMSVEEVEKHKYKITGAFYDPTKFARVEEGIYLPSAPYTNVPTGALTSPTSIDAQSFTYTTGAGENHYYGVVVSWQQADDPRVIYYELEDRSATGVWDKIGTTSLNEYTIQPITPGIWDFRVRSRGVTDYSSWLTLTDYIITTISGVLPPSNLTTIDDDTTWEGPNCEMKWTASAGAYYAGYDIDEVIKGYQVEILRSTDDEPLRTQALGNVTDYIYTYEMNVEDNYAADSSGPTRGLKITVYAISVYDETETTGVTATLTNPIPVIVGAPTVEAMFQGVKIDWRNITPADNDGSKFVIYCDTDTPPSSGVGTNDWLTRTWYETGLDTDDVYYAQIEPYDGFGVGTKSSVSATFEPLKVAEVDIDGELSSSIAMSDSLGTSASGLAVLYDRTIDSGGITYSGTGWVDYDFGIEDLKDGVKVYTASGTRMYVSYAGNDDVRHYLSGEADHTLDTEGAMVSRASEALAITNYLTVDAGKVVPKFPQRIIASSCRIHFTIEAILYELVFEREVVAELVVADSLSAISANIGTVTAGLIQSDDGNTIFDLDEGYIRVTDDLDVTRVLLGKIS